MIFTHISRFFVLFIYVFFSHIKPTLANDEFDDDFLVHVTRHMMTNSTAIPGASYEHKLTDPNYAPEIRCTLHHTLGNMVPESGMLEITSFGGMPTYLPTTKTVKYKYAWIDRLRNFRGHTFGGLPEDVFTYAHTYGDGSYVVLPEEDIRKFKTQNPDFAGVIRTFNAEIKTLRETIHDVLLKQRGHVIEYAQIEGSPLDVASQYILSRGDAPLDAITFKQYLQERSLYQGIHSRSPWHLYERIFQGLAEPFHYFHILKAPSPWRTLPCLIEVESRLIQMKLATSTMMDASAHLDQKTVDQLNAWITHNEEYLNLYRLEVALRKMGKSLFINNPQHWPHIFENRGQMALEEAQETLSVPLESDPCLEPSKKQFLPPYLHQVFFFDPLWARRLVEDTPLTLEQKVGHQAYVLLRRTPHLAPSDAGLHRAWKYMFEDFHKIAAPSAAFRRYIHKILNEILSQETTHASSTLIQLANALGPQHFGQLFLPQANLNDDTPVTFQTLLQYLPSLGCLWGNAPWEPSLLRIYTDIFVNQGQVTADNIREVSLQIATQALAYMHRPVYADRVCKHLFMNYVPLSLSEAYLHMNAYIKQNIVITDVPLHVVRYAASLVGRFEEHYASADHVLSLTDKACLIHISMRMILAANSRLSPQQLANPRLQAAFVPVPPNSKAGFIPAYEEVFRNLDDLGLRDKPLDENILTLLKNRMTDVVSLLYLEAFGGLLGVLEQNGLRTAYDDKFREKTDPWKLSLSLGDLISNLETKGSDQCRLM